MKIIAGVTVTDQDKALNFYTTKLGLRRRRISKWALALVSMISRLSKVRPPH